MCLFACLQLQAIALCIYVCNLCTNKKCCNFCKTFLKLFLKTKKEGGGWKRSFVSKSINRDTCVVHLTD